MKTKSPLFYLLFRFAEFGFAELRFASVPHFVRQSFIICLLLSKAFAKATAFKAAALCSVLCALSFAPSALSQIPQGFNYQAVARDGSGNPIMNTALPVMITIQADSLGTSILWQELHSSVTSNSFGMINLVIGRGARQSASSVATFSAIDWSITPKFIKTEIDYSGWKTMGVSRLWSVPYALVAEDLAGSVKKLAVEGETALLDEALFEVKNKNGQTIFAVYNEGVRIYVDDGAKGPKGGFAVGGFDMTKATKREYFVVSDDSVRIYLDSNPLTKGKKSGFAVGGYDMTKGVIQNYLDVSADSTRIYVNDDPAKKVKGGFAVGGFDATKGTVTPFTVLTQENYLIGQEAGKEITTGKYNSFLGYQAGMGTTEGSSNSLMGYQAGFRNTTGLGNLLLGYQSGYNNTTGNYNTFLGYLAGNKNDTGLENTFVGSFAGNKNLTGSNNTFLGFNTGLNNSSGGSNSFIGTSSGYSNTTGNHNVFIGTESGYANTKGSYNSFIGYHTGHSNTKGRFNVFQGYEAGYSNDSSFNTFIGYQVGKANNSGLENVYLGYKTGYANNGSQNVIIGSGASQNSISSGGNVIIGYKAGMNAGVNSSILVGMNSGYSWQTSSGAEILIGHFTGEYVTQSGGFNLFFGQEAGRNATNPAHNHYIGFGAGMNSQGVYNNFFGHRAGDNSSGSYNIALGTNAGRSAGDWNIILGNFTGENCTGGNNILIGHAAGRYVTGINNIMIGKWAGCNEANSNRLYISHTDDGGDYTASNALIYGEFDNEILAFDAEVGIGTIRPAKKLHIHNTSGDQHLYLSSVGPGIQFGNNEVFTSSNMFGLFGLATSVGHYGINAGDLVIGTYGGSHGNVYINANYNSSDTRYVILQPTTGNVGIGTSTPGYKLQVGAAGDGTQARANAWNLLSDIRYKSDIEYITDPLEKISGINGFYFHWNTGTDKTRQFGLSAQDVEKVLPEVVSTGDDGFKSVDYGKLVPLLVEGINTQQAQIVSQNSKIESQQTQIDELKAMIEKLLEKTSPDRSGQAVQTP